MAYREITNIKSKAVSIVSEEQWANIEKAGWAKKYKVKLAPMGAKRPPFIPDEVKDMKASKQESKQPTETTKEDKK